MCILYCFSEKLSKKWVQLIFVAQKQKQEFCFFFSFALQFCQFLCSNETAEWKMNRNKNNSKKKTDVKRKRRLVTSRRKKRQMKICFIFDQFDWCVLLLPPKICKIPRCCCCFVYFFFVCLLLCMLFWVCVHHRSLRHLEVAQFLDVYIYKSCEKRQNRLNDVSKTAKCSHQKNNNNKINTRIMKSER